MVLVFANGQSILKTRDSGIQISTRGPSSRRGCMSSPGRDASSKKRGTANENMYTSEDVSTQ